VYFFCILALIL